MPWVFITDELHENDKVMEASGDAVKLWLVTLSWVNAKMTDGHIPAVRARSLAAFVRNPDKVITELVQRRMWHHAGRICKRCVMQRAAAKVTEDVPDGGYYVHDYFEFQRPAWAIAAARAKMSEAGKRGNATRWADRLPDRLPDRDPDRPPRSGTRSGTRSPDPIAPPDRPYPSTPYPVAPVTESDRSPGGSGDLGAPEPDVPDDAPGHGSDDRERGRGRGRLRPIRDIMSR